MQKPVEPSEHSEKPKQFGTAGVLFGSLIPIICLLFSEQVYDLLVYTLDIVPTYEWKSTALFLFFGPPPILGIVGYIVGLVHDQIYYKPKYEIALRNYKEEMKIRKEAQRKVFDGYQIKYKVPTGIFDYGLSVEYIKGFSIIKSNEKLQMLVWKDGDNLCLLDKDYINCKGKIEVPLEKITSFSRQGDIFHETNISGGGGGGASIKGAVIGEVIAGPTGAIIGGRKGVEPIKTEHKVIDKRQTILEIEEQGNMEYIYFGSAAYDVFIDLIPGKEISFVNNRGLKNEEQDVFEQLKKLSELKEENIITEEEFIIKKKLLLDKIS